MRRSPRRTRRQRAVWPIVTGLLGIVLLTPAARSQAAGGATLVPFRSDRELARFLREAARAQQRRRQSTLKSYAAPSCKGSVTSAIDSSARGRGPAVVKGVVRDGHAAGAPAAGLAGAAVTIATLGTGVLTTSDGAFHLVVPADSLAAPRTVTVTARRIGFAARSHTVSIRRGDQVTLGLPLCQQVVMLESVVLTGAAPGQESITNTQHEGVDEGGIVKRHGDLLVILRRGRLFTVDVSQGRLRPVASIDAFGPGIDPAWAWYDEMLVAGDRVVVIGYSYKRGGTELGVFRIDRAGGLRHEATHHLRSDDYYSSRNYASRLVGDRLVLYAPLDFRGDTARPLDALPAMRRWQVGDTGVFRPIAAARRVYRPAGRADPAAVETMHTVTSCDLAAREISCESAVVLGPGSRSFYVSPTAVYVATAAGRSCPSLACPVRRDAEPSMLLRMPLDGGRPSALRTFGSPIDQFSFLEESGRLNLLLQADGPGDRMWRAEWGRERFALLQLPVERFTDGTRSAPGWAYRPLPGIGGQPSSVVHNRFVGRHLLYGVGNGWRRPNAMHPDLFVVPLDRGGITRLPMPHGIDRIEVMGRDAVVVGSDSADLHFTGVRLARSPALAQRHVLRGASQGELRSHGFFFKPDRDTSGAGTLGLPVRGPGRPGWRHLVDESASIVFLRSERGAFDPLGELAARPDSAGIRDGCKASCVDWYGNARPLFFDDRILALLGYELVEGRLREGRVEEVGRASFAPGAGGRSADAAAAGSPSAPANP